MKQQDIEDLRQLIEFLKSHGVSEFDVDRGDLKIRLKFNPQESGPASLGDLARLLQTAPQNVAQAAATHAGPAAGSGAGAGTGSAGAEPAANADAGLHMVKSPIVGTYYGSPSPGASPFVAPGDHVEKGQVIGIIEAMKLMNEIESDVAGEVVKCMVSNGQAIEFGQPLFSIRQA
jgi:acetyl-CoA carboxylase biotin carboxyl carrier protein